MALLVRWLRLAGMALVAAGTVFVRLSLAQLPQFEMAELLFSMV
jgi:hypothetical protein